MYAASGTAYGAEKGTRQEGVNQVRKKLNIVGVHQDERDKLELIFTNYIWVVCWEFLVTEYIAHC
jgi:hypothetical protein